MEDESQIFVHFCPFCEAGVFPLYIAFSVKRILWFLYWLLNLHSRVQVTNSKAIMLDGVMLFCLLGNLKNLDG